MDAYIGDSLFYDKNIFSGYNIATPGMTSKEIFEKVEGHPKIWSCFDKIILSSIGNDILRSLDLNLAESYLRDTIDFLIGAGAKKIILIELPELQNNNMPSAKYDNLIHFKIARDYDRVFLTADIYREQLAINQFGDNVHLNDIGNYNLYERIQDVSSRSLVYNYVIEHTSNHLGADILERSGITLEFAEYLADHCRDWICAYEKTVEAGYTGIVDIVAGYDQQTLYNNFIDI
jgi:hypothetical protein